MIQKDSAFTRSSTDSDRLGRFVAGGSAVMIASTVSGLLQFAWTILMTRTLGPAGFGILGPFLNAYWLVATLAMMGVPQAVVTFVAADLDTDRAAAERTIAEGSLLELVLTSGLLILSVAGGGLLYTSGHISLFAWGILVSMALSVIGRHGYYAAFGALTGIQRMDLVAISNALPPVVMLIVSIVFVKWIDPSLRGHFNRRVLLFISPIIITALVASILGILLMKRGGLRAGLLYTIRRPTQWKKLIAFGWSANVAYLGFMVLTAFTPTVVSLMARQLRWFGPTQAANDNAAGFFSTGYVYAMAPLLIVGLTFALLPAAAEAEASGNRKLLQRYFDVSLRYCCTLMGALLAVYFSLGGRIVRAFSGHSYDEKTMAPLTAILAFGVGISALYLLMTNLLTGIKRPVVPSRTSFVMLIAQWGLFILVGKTTGNILDLATAFAFTMAAGVAALLIYSRIRIGLLIRPAILVIPGATALIVAAIVHTLTPPGFIPMVAAIFLALPAYMLIIGFLGGVDADDLDLLRQTLTAVGGKPLSFLIDLLEKLFRLSPLFPKNTDNTTSQ